MNIATILATDEGVREFADFELNGMRFVFRHLPASGCDFLIEGPCWIFIDHSAGADFAVDLCRRLRADPRTSQAHIVMLAEDGNAIDRQAALDAGADEYLAGPASRQDMLDRILTRISASGLPSAPVRIEAGNLLLELREARALCNGVPLSLGLTEFRLLRFLAENPNRVFSRQELITALGKSGDPDYLRTVDVWIKRLRASLRQAGSGHILRTVIGKGYVLDIL
jgi:two-component system, OmpR family, phosphate regulon response regulator PhoB